MFQTTDMKYGGRALGLNPESVGLLRRSDDAVSNRDELWRRMEKEGYLYLPGLLRGHEVLDGRLEIMRRLAAGGALETGQPLMDGVPAVDAPEAFSTQRLTSDNPPLQRLLYDGEMISFYEFFLGGEVRHFDVTWFRVKLPGSDSTTPHYDIVYMGRGTTELFTSWVPFGARRRSRWAAS